MVTTDMLVSTYKSYLPSNANVDRAYWERVYPRRSGQGGQRRPSGDEERPSVGEERPSGGEERCRSSLGSSDRHRPARYVYCGEDTQGPRQEKVRC